MTIRPDRRLLNLVRLSAAAALAAGLVIILHLPLPAPLRALAAVGWLAGEGRQLVRWSAAAGRLQRLRFGADGIHGIFESGICCPLTPTTGSVVAADRAWLRLRDDAGRIACVLLARKRMPQAAWRRLTVCWRLRR